MEIVPADPEYFDARLSRDYAGSLALANVHTSPGTVRHTRAHLKNTADRGYTLLAPMQGGFHLHLDRQAMAAVKVGDFCMVDHSMPYELTHDQPSHTFCIGVEDALLRRLLPQPERMTGLVVRSACSTSRLLTNVLQQLSAELELESTTLTSNLAQNSAYILRRRLERSGSALRDANWRALSITEIAFRNGFNNATHFGQAFKSEFGVTPRDYRRRADLLEHERRSR